MFARFADELINSLKYFIAVSNIPDTLISSAFFNIINIFSKEIDCVYIFFLLFF